MNERIKLLAEQAGLTWRVQPLHYTNTNNPIDFPVSANRDLEKFALLIIRECAESLWTEECYNSDLAIEEFEKHSKKITEHFGVEE